MQCFLVFAADLLIDQAQRSWPQVLRVALTNYFALLALVGFVAGAWLFFRVKGWGKSAGMLTVMAGALLLFRVLHDIKAEIPGHVVRQHSTSVEN